MASRHNDNKKPKSDRRNERKRRRCLMCTKHFVSEHFGQRVCPTCKGTAAWRSGGEAA
jgi:Zn finger protein HypA/HybF involved in hydrogenase expression